jgi:hypothetical protein
MSNDFMMSAFHVFSNPAFVADKRTGLTFCNRAVREFIRLAVGLELPLQLANDMMENKHFLKLGKMAKVAQELVNNGNVVVAGLKAENHGHVAVVLPGPIKWSYKWKRETVCVMDIGKNHTMGGLASFAFPEPPDFYLIDERGGQ